MSDYIISDRVKELNRIHAELAEWYGAPTKKLVYFLYSKGYTSYQIAEILNVTHQAISAQFPKKAKYDK